MNSLRTPRLVLDPVTPRNCGVLWRVMQGAHLREYQDVPRCTREEFEQRVAARPKRFDARAVGRFEWLVSLADPPAAIGWVSLRLGDHARGAGEIGYSLLAPFRGEGYASEATCAVVDAVLERGGLRRITACCVPGNAASRRLLERLGFEQGRLQRNGAVVGGRAVDVLAFELSRERWLAARADYDGSANSIVMPASAKLK